METSITSLRRAVKDGDALGSLPDLEADCQRTISIPILSEINSQETFPVYSEDIADIYPINSTPVRDPAVDISFSFQEFLETETVLSSNPSSINGEEFNGDLDLPSPVVLPITKFFPANLDIMEEKKAEITAKWREVTIQMRVFTINQLKATNRKARYPIVSEKIETLLANLLNLYEELFDMIVDKDGDEMKAEQEKCTQQEGEIKDFLSNLEDRYYELEAEEASTDEASVPAADKSVASLKQAMKEQLEDSRRREKDEK